MRKLQLPEDELIENNKQKQLKRIISPWRWIVEQFFAHLEKARRLVMIYDRKLNSYLGFVKLRVITLLIRRMSN